MLWTGLLATGWTDLACCAAAATGLTLAPIPTRAGEGTQAALGCPFALLLEVDGCPRSSSQELIVAARSASLPFLPDGFSDVMAGAGLVAISSLWDLTGDRAALLGTGSKLPVNTVQYE